MDVRDDVGMVVGVFRDRAGAHAASEALVRSGFAPEVVQPDLLDAELLAAVSEADRTEWEQELEGRRDTLVIVRDSRREQARAILADNGVEDVSADDAPLSGATAVESRPPGSGMDAPTIAERLRPDMFVVGSDYKLIGRIKRIKRIKESELLLDRRPLRRDVWVPLIAVDKMIADWVVLAMPADQVDPMEPFLRPRIGERRATQGRSAAE